MKLRVAVCCCAVLVLLSACAVAAESVRFIGQEVIAESERNKQDSGLQDLEPQGNLVVAEELLRAAEDFFLGAESVSVEATYKAGPDGFSLLDEYFQDVPSPMVITTDAILNAPDRHVVAQHPDFWASHEYLVVQDQAYLRATADLWDSVAESHRMSIPADKLGAENLWVSNPPLDVVSLHYPVRSLLSDTAFDEFYAETATVKPDVLEADIDGHPVYVVTEYREGVDDFVFYISQDADRHLVAAQGPAIYVDGRSPGTVRLVFSNWNAVAPPQLPVPGEVFE